MLIALLCRAYYTAGEAGQPKMYFCDGRNFRAKFRPSHFWMCCYSNMFDHGCASLVFLRSAMVVYPCDIHKVPRLLTGKKGQLKKEVPSVAMMTNFGFGPVVCTKSIPKASKPMENAIGVTWISFTITFCEQHAPSLTMTQRGNHFYP